MRNTFLIVLVSLLFFGCGKDKFSTVPKLKFESVNTEVLYPDQIIRFKLSFTDLEGDLQDSFYVEKVVTKCPTGGFKRLNKMPVFPTTKNSSGEIEVAYAHGINIPGYITLGEPQCAYNDTCYFRFMIKDKAQNKSDTINSPTIVIIKD